MTSRAALFLVALGAGCSGHVAGGGGGEVTDAGRGDAAPFIDAGPRVDAAVSQADAPLGGADARVLDAGGAPDAPGSCAPLALASLPNGYLEHSATATTDVTSGVSGTGPFTCAFNTTGGTGTRPANASLTGCALSGGAGTGQPRGAYGFMVTVRDGCGETLDVPVAMNAGPCEDVVSLSPAPWPPRVPTSPLIGYAWDMSVELDLVATGPGTCSWCYDFLISTRFPAQLTQGYKCANDGVICSDCTACVEQPSTCMQSVTMSRQLTIKAHDRLRPTGPAWLTTDLGLQYAGTTVSPCGNKRWTCHLETLER